MFVLYDTLCPRTARNFRELATGLYGFGYANSAFHRVVPDVRFALPEFAFTREESTGLQPRRSRRR